LGSRDFRHGWRTRHSYSQIPRERRSGNQQSDMQRLHIIPLDAKLGK
jgi:hypothetical protein